MDFSKDTFSLLDFFIFIRCKGHAPVVYFNVISNIKSTMSWCITSGKIKVFSKVNVVGKHNRYLLKTLLTFSKTLFFFSAFAGGLAITYGATSIFVSPRVNEYLLSFLVHAS